MLAIAQSRTALVNRIESKAPVAPFLAHFTRDEYDGARIDWLRIVHYPANPR